MASIDRKIQYENQGYLHLPGLIPPALVSRLKTAFDRSFARQEKIWKEEVAQGKADPRFLDLPNILDEDESFIELVDFPDLLPYLMMTIGSSIQLNHTHARIFPPGKTFTARWHSDVVDVQGIDLAHSPNFFVKVHFYFEDLHPDQGCLAFLPGTHRLPASYPRPQLDGGESSPAAVKIIPKAGDAVLFNTHLLHMALDNKSALPRKSIIYAYSHFWLKNYANAVPTQLEKYATTPLRKQMFGVETEGVSYFDQRYDVERATSPHSSFWGASRRIIRRIQKTSSTTRK